MAKKKPQVVVNEVVQTDDLYTVLITFKDKDGTIYAPGMTYQSADAEWLNYLSGDTNRRGEPIIRK